jgi:predicted class III extradiol MEMO1 family dioxygenase
MLMAYQTCWLLILRPTRGLCVQVLGCKQCVSELMILSPSCVSTSAQLFIYISSQRTAIRSARFEHADAHHSKRVFLLGPSHHFYLEKAALTRCTHYGTPLGNLPIDTATTADLYKTGQFDWMSQDVDEDEHSLEMHLPYIYKMLSK